MKGICRRIWGSNFTIENEPRLDLYEASRGHPVNNFYRVHKVWEFRRVFQFIVGAHDMVQAGTGALGFE